MLQRTDTLIFNTVAERLDSRTPSRAVGEIAMTALGFTRLPEELLYRTTRNLLSDDTALPLQLPAEQISQKVSAILLESESAATPRLNNIQLTRFVNLLVQFGDRASASEAMATPAPQIQGLYNEIVAKAESDGPINYSDQLDIALSQTPHIPSAVWNLFLASRQYARWRDADIIEDFPVLTRQQKLDQMVAWENSLAAIKESDTYGFQDSAGDAYYVWTQALARVIYTALPEKPGLLSHSYAKAFEYGSHAMSTFSMLGKISALGTMSNHIPAARYGNSIGDSIARRVKEINLNT